MNRLKDYLAESPEQPPHGDFWVVTGAFGFFCVPADAARRIERELDRRKPPRWITFADVVGSHVRIRSRDVQSVYESTAGQRAREREIDRARRVEEKADRLPWETDE